MKRLISLSMALCSCILSFAQSSYYLSDDRELRVPLPSDWKVSKLSGAGKLFSYSPADDKGKVECAFWLESDKVPKSQQYKTIREISVSHKSDYGIYNTTSLLRNQVVEVNNKPWWEFETVTTGSFGATSYTLLTVHNGKYYRLVFTGSEEMYKKYSRHCQALMKGFMFLSADKSLYKNDTPPQPVESLIAMAEPFAGTYTYTSKEPAVTNIYTLTIGKASEGVYHASETREVQYRDEGTYKFQASLKPESATATELIVQTDAVSFVTPDVPWAKAKYKIRKTATGYTGLIYSSNKDIPPIEVKLVKQGTKPGETATGATANNKNQAVQSPVNNPPNSNANASSVSPRVEGGQQTGSLLRCGTLTGEAVDEEKSAIRACGDNKVTRKGTQLIIATAKKTITLTNRGTEDDMTLFAFIGQIPQLGSYVVRSSGYESEAYMLVNKTSAASITIPNLDLYFSPDAKQFAVFSSDIATRMEESTIAIFAVTPSALTSVYKYVTYDNQKNSGWGTGSLKWIDNNSIEVEKMVVANEATEELSPAGKGFFIRQGNKWIITNTMPGVTLTPSAGNVPDDVMPYVPMRKVTGGKTIDDLGRMVFNAVKLNDKKAFYACHQQGTQEASDKRLAQIRKDFEGGGLNNWSLAKYSATKFHANPAKRKDARQIHQFMKVEFFYGTGQVGQIRGSMGNATAEKIEGKFVVDQPFSEGFLASKAVMGY